MLFGGGFNALRASRASSSFPAQESCDIDSAARLWFCPSSHGADALLSDCLLRGRLRLSPDTSLVGIDSAARLLSCSSWHSVDALLLLSK